MPAGLDWDERDAGGDGSWLLLGAKSGAKGMESGSKMESQTSGAASSRCLTGTVMGSLCYKNGVLVLLVLLF